MPEQMPRSLFSTLVLNFIDILLHSKQKNGDAPSMLTSNILVILRLPVPFINKE